MTYEYKVANNNARNFLEMMEDENTSNFDIACELLLGVTPSAYQEMQEYAERGE